MNIGEQLLNVIKSVDFENVFVIDSNKKTKYAYGKFFYECIMLSEEIECQSNSDTIVAILENGYTLFKLYFVAMLLNKDIVVIDPLKGASEINELTAGMEQGLLIQEDNVNVENPLLMKLDKSIFEKYETASDTVGKDLVLDRFKKIDFYKTYLTTFTSGTSGVTKGVQHSLENILSTAFAFQKASSEDRGSCFLHVMPMTYMAGILNSIFLPFVMQEKIVLGKRFDVRGAITFWKTVKEYEVDTFWLSPTMLTMIEQVDRGSVGEEYCNKKKLCFWIGTAALTEKIRTQFEGRYGVPLNASYGLSETLFVSVENERTRAVSGKNSVGTLLEGVEYQIENDGELLLYVPWMYKGYTNEDDKEYFSGKYYRTGDLVKIKDNILYIIGRKKELIIKGGLNISPVRIEECVNRIEGVRENAVFGMSNTLGEEVTCCAYVIDKEISVSDIEAAINGKVIAELGKNYKIDEFLNVKQLPRNINGKVDKNELKKRRVANDS